MPQDLSRRGQFSAAADEHALGTRSVGREDGAPEQGGVDKGFVVDEFIVLGRLGFAVRDEGAAEVGIDHLDLLELGNGGVIDGVEFHF